MTQNTQTTAERIAEMVHPSSPFDLYDVAVSIAAEIDRLTGERDGYLADVIFNQNWIADMQRRTDLVIAQVTKERDEARADLAKCGADLQYEFDNPGDSRRRIAELEAEAERMRPSAEAWEAQEEYADCIDHNGSEPYALGMAMKAAAARARARAAKEAKP